MKPTDAARELARRFGVSPGTDARQVDSRPLTDFEIHYLRERGIQYPWRARDLLRLQRRVDELEGR